jgi:hypothetical protein
MKFVSGAVLAFSMMVSASVAHAGDINCDAPVMPAIPSSFDTEEALKATYGEVKEYVAKSEEYRECLMAQERLAGEDVTPEFSAKITELHDGNIDDAESVAAQFNTAYKAWKEAHPSE